MICVSRYRENWLIHRVIIQVHSSIAFRGEGHRVLLSLPVNLECPLEDLYLYVLCISFAPLNSHFPNLPLLRHWKIPKCNRNPHPWCVYILCIHILTNHTLGMYNVHVCTLIFTHDHVHVEHCCRLIETHQRRGHLKTLRALDWDTPGYYPILWIRTGYCWIRTDTNYYLGYLPDTVDAPRNKARNLCLPPTPSFMLLGVGDGYSRTL